jgi:hypothetical protein
VQDQRFDALTRFVSRAESRRAFLRGAGTAGLAALGITTLPESSLAQDASPVASPIAGSPAAGQAGLDALDPDTKDAIARVPWTTADALTVEDVPPDALVQILGPKNSNEAFGLRIGARLLELVAQPLSFLPSSAPRFEKLATVVESLNAHQALLVAMLMGGEQSRGWGTRPTSSSRSGTPRT